MIKLDPIVLQKELKDKIQEVQTLKRQIEEYGFRVVYIDGEPIVIHDRDFSTLISLKD